MISKRAGGVLALALMLVLSGCGGGEGGGRSGDKPSGGHSAAFYGSCVYQDWGLCNELVGSHYAADPRGQCETDIGGMGPGAYSTDHCSVANALGTCRLKAGDPQELVGYYYADKWYGSMDAGACQDAGGSWTAL